MLGLFTRYECFEQAPGAWSVGALPSEVYVLSLIDNGLDDAKLASLSTERKT